MLHQSLIIDSLLPVNRPTLLLINDLCIYFESDLSLNLEHYLFVSVLTNFLYKIWKIFPVNDLILEGIEFFD